MRVISIGSDYALAQRLKSVQAAKTENTAPGVAKQNTEADDKPEPAGEPEGTDTDGTGAAQEPATVTGTAKKAGKKKKEATEESI